MQEQDDVDDDEMMRCGTLVSNNAQKTTNNNTNKTKMRAHKNGVIVFGAEWIIIHIIVIIAIIMSTSCFKSILFINVSCVRIFLHMKIDSRRPEIK